MAFCHPRLIRRSMSVVTHCMRRLRSSASSFACCSRACCCESVLVSVSQCHEKSTQGGNYQSEAALAETGVIAGGDMTHEAALAKLFTLLSLSMPQETVRQLLTRNLCGELTPPQGGAR